jgi:response regulator RpfG family c-di-GMP phosphodiesterase
MRKISVLLFNFNIESALEPWFENSTLYIIRTTNSIQELKQKYNGYKFDLVFLKASKSVANDRYILSQLKSLFHKPKIITITKKLTARKVLEYTKLGAYEVRRDFKDEVDFMNSLINYTNNTKNSFRKKNNQQAVSVTNTLIISLLKTKGEYENEILKHLNVVGQYTRVITEHVLSCSPAFMEYVYLGSKLHDIGKIDIPNKILSKPTALTSEEFDVVKTHTHYGYGVLSEIEQSVGGSSKKFLEIAKGIALYHHENYNGTGYPNGLKGEEIPLPARICALADVYDALSTDRPYRDALSHKKICDIILNEEKYKYDPEILEIFRSYNEVFEEICLTYKQCTRLYPSKIRKQCAWCKSLFLFNKWLPYSETINEASHGVCPECVTHLKKPVTE